MAMRSSSKNKSLFAVISLLLLSSSSSCTCSSSMCISSRRLPIGLKERRKRNIEHDDNYVVRQGHEQQERGCEVVVGARCLSSIKRGGGGDSGVKGEGSASIPSLVFNLVKSIVGAGVLSLPAGIAAFGDSPQALLPVILLVVTIGSLSAYNFSLIGRVCDMTSATSYRSAWDKSVGSSTSWITALFCTAQCLVANLAYSMILADTFKTLLQSLGVATLSRTQTLFGTTLFVILPLCLLKNLSSLAPFSLLGIMGMLYTALAMSVRYLTGSYALPDGKFIAELPPQYKPTFGSKGAMSVFQPSSLVLLCMLSAAFVAHYIAPKFYMELYDNTIRRFNILVVSSYLISMLIFLTVAGMGFLTFGSACDGLVLNNYASADTIMGASRVAVAVSLVFSYPLVFVGARDGVLDLLSISPSKRTNAYLNKLTVLLLSCITALASKVKDLSMVIAVAGSVLGVSLIYVFPSLMFRSAVKNMGDDADALLKMEANLVTLSGVMGVVMGMVGLTLALTGKR